MTRGYKRKRWNVQLIEMKIQSGEHVVGPGDRRWARFEVRKMPRGIRTWPI